MYEDILRPGTNGELFVADEAGDSDQLGTEQHSLMHRGVMPSKFFNLLDLSCKGW